MSKAIRDHIQAKILNKTSECREDIEFISILSKAYLEIAQAEVMVSEQQYSEFCRTKQKQEFEAAIKDLVNGGSEVSG